MRGAGAATLVTVLVMLAGMRWSVPMAADGRDDGAHAEGAFTFALIGD